MSSSLRQRAAVGTVYLALRRAFGVGLSFLGLVLVTRAVGPSAYGLFAAATAVLAYLHSLGQMGIRLYLIRAPEQEVDQLAHQSFSWLLTAGVTLSLLCASVLGGLAAAGVSDRAFVTVALSLVATAPIGLILTVPSTLLERRLEYKRTALVEIAAQASFYLVSIPLAQAGYGVWSLVAGQWTQLTVSVVGMFWAAGYRPRWRWYPALVRDMLRYSFTQALSGWIYDLRNLGIGLVLLPLAGAEVVGYYALAQRLLQMLSVVKEAVSRVSAPVYAHVQENTEKLLIAICRSAQAQTLGLGGACLIVALGGHWLLPLLFGTQWDIPMALTMFAFLASEQMLSAIFGAQAQALHIRRHSIVVVKIATLFIINFFTIATLFVWIAPTDWKGIAFAASYWAAHLPNNWLYHRLTPKYIGSPQYRMSISWALGLSVALFAPVVSYWLLLALSVFLWPASLSEIRALAQEVRPRPTAQSSESMV